MKVLMRLNLCHLLFFLIFWAPANVIAQSNAKVTDVDFYQPRGKDEIVITYDIVRSRPGETFNVDIRIKTLTGKVLPAKTFTGDVGAGIPGGKNKKVIWNVGYDKLYIAESIYVEVLATVEGQNASTPQREHRGWYMQFGVALNAPARKKHFSEFDIWRFETTAYPDDPDISLGNSSGIDVTLGYGLIDQLGLECRFMLQQGNEFTVISQENQSGFYGEYKNSISGNALSVAPLGVFHITRPRLNYYFKIGPMYSLARVNYSFTFNEIENGVQKFGNQHYELKAGIEKGLYTEAGILLLPHRLISLSLGVSYKKFDFTPDKGELTDYYWSVDGGPYSEIEFVEDGEQLNTSGQTTQRYSKEHPFSSLGLNFGLIIHL